MRHCAYFFLCGALAALALPPLGWLVFVPGLLVLLWQAASASDARKAGLIGSMAGFGWFAVSLYWISHALFVGSPLYLLLLPFSAIGLPLFLGLFWGAAAMLGWSLSRYPPARLVWIALSIGLAEWLRSWLLTGFPWNAPGQLFLATDAMAQMGALFGQNGLNILLFASLAGLGIVMRHRWTGLILMLPLLLGMVWGYLRLDSAPPLARLDDAGGAAQIRLIQPAIPQPEKWQADRRAGHLQKLLELGLEKLPVPQLVIWPESAFAGFWPAEGNLLGQLARTALPEDGFLLTGLLQSPAPNQLYNSVIMLDSRGQKQGLANKQRLVPFGEYVPLRFLPFLDALAGPTDFVPGGSPASFSHPQLGQMQVLICYEVIFPGFIAAAVRPDFLVNITNDAWFGRTSGPYQHLAQSRARAIEEGLPLMRVANTGISAGFDGYGRELGRLGLGEAGFLDLPLPAALPATPFVQARLAGFLLLAGLMAAAGLFLDRSGQKRQ